MVTTQDGKFNVILPTPGTMKEFMSVAWACRVTGDRSEANLDIYPDVDNLEKQILTFSQNPKIPYAKNFKAIKAGDELILFRRAKATQPVESLPEVKRRKVGKYTA